MSGKTLSCIECSIEVPIGESCPKCGRFAVDENAIPNTPRFWAYVFFRAATWPLLIFLPLMIMYPGWKSMGAYGAVVILLVPVFAYLAKADE